jgi:hypothetical protein
MSRAKRPRFKVKELVGLRGTFGFGQIHARKLFEHGFSYELFPVTEHHASGWYDENDLRKLTAREKGGRR